MNNFCFLINLPEFLKKNCIKCLTFAWFWCLLALVYIPCRYGVLVSVKLVAVFLICAEYSCEKSCLTALFLYCSRQIYVGGHEGWPPGNNPTDAP